MASEPEPSFATTLEIRDACLCLHLQRAARAVARRFDQAFRPLGLTNGQFSLLMALNRPQPPTISDVARLLAMDRTTLTADLKPLERRGLVEITIDNTDRRSRRPHLTPVGRETHACIEAALAAGANRLRADLRALAAFAPPSRCLPGPPPCS